MPRKLHFSETANAIESTQKALRRMLQNPSLFLPAPPKDGWKEFSQVQLAALAIARRLIDFGFSVGHASDAANEIILHGLPEPPGLWEPQILNAGRFLHLLSDLYFTVRFEEGVRQAEIKRSKGWPKLTGSLSILVVPVGAVVKRAFERASVAPEDDMTGADLAVIDAFAKRAVQLYRSVQDSPATQHSGTTPPKKPRQRGKVRSVR